MREVPSQRPMSVAAKYNYEDKSVQLTINGIGAGESKFLVLEFLPSVLDAICGISNNADLDDPEQYAKASAKNRSMAQEVGLEIPDLHNH